MKKIIKIIKKLLIRLSVFFVLLFFGLSLSPVIEKNSALTPKKTQLAKQSAKRVWEKLSSTHTFVELEITQIELDAIMNAAAHSIPSSRFEARLSNFGMILLASKSISIWGDSVVYLNLNCLLTSNDDIFEIETCHIGSIPLPGFIAQFLINSSVSLVFGSDVKNTLEELIQSAKVSNNKVTLFTTKKYDLKTKVKSSVKTVTSTIRAINKNENINNDRVVFYVDQLKKIKASEDSLGFYIGQLFYIVKNESFNRSPTEENTAALWALAITFGDQSFARFIGLEKQITLSSYKPTTLRGRGDLVLHFLYSTILEQIGDSDIGLSIGEIKELLDSNKGGSGYSFADLAADKAGLMFSSMLVESKEQAKYAQTLLASSNNESLFFPFVHDLPEGFKGNEFQKVFNNIRSPLYKEQEKTIDNRITALPLYLRDKKQKDTIQEKFVPIFNQNNIGTWLTVDTHIHTKFSDGNQTVSQIAKQASNFGCDAIAITDHGDYNLTKVATPEYFDAINIENNNYPYMTIIPGVEWNIPPFMGREHATVLLPESIYQQRNLYAFKDRYDSWGRRDKKLLSAQQAFEWLNTKAIVNGIKPIVIYNHPSRKDKQQEENQHDMSLWRSFNDIAIGFSGAPGHQKNRTENNGSYTYKLKTKNGWDPSIANIGAEWDKLLQQGYLISAARAPSDFHGTGGDYWPCEFSTTHLFSRTKQQNDILQAFRNGNYWAQHGKFVKKLDFNISNKKQNSGIGETLIVPMYEEISVSLDISLNEKDWQNYPTSLDDIELIIITPDKIESIYFDPLMYETGGTNKFNFTHKHIVKTKHVTFRWRGKSIQPEEHHYMFYTNAIKVVNNDR
jgi:histidinol phosphatase-like PHP family hydrolase